MPCVGTGDAHDPDQAWEGGSDVDDDDDIDDGDEGGGATSSSTRIVTSLNLDDVSSSEEEEDGDDSDGNDGGGAAAADGGRGEKKASKHGSGREGKRVHWGQEEAEEDADGRGGGGGKCSRQQQANVFAGVKGAGMPDDSVEEKMRQLDQQDEKARRAGGGVAGQAELRRAREALRLADVFLYGQLHFWTGHTSFRRCGRTRLDQRDIFSHLRLFLSLRRLVRTGTNRTKKRPHVRYVEFNSKIIAEM